MPIVSTTAAAASSLDGQIVWRDAWKYLEASNLHFIYQLGVFDRCRVMATDIRVARSRLIDSYVNETSLQRIDTSGSAWRKRSRTSIVSAELLTPSRSSIKRAFHAPAAAYRAHTEQCAASTTAGRGCSNSP